MSGDERGGRGGHESELGLCSAICVAYERMDGNVNVEDSDPGFGRGLADIATQGHEQAEHWTLQETASFPDAEAYAT